jgi:hypothetical protein
VQNELRNWNEELADDLGRLHEWRKIADYDILGFPDMHEQVQFALVLAREIVARIQAIP